MVHSRLRLQRGGGEGGGFTGVIPQRKEQNHIQTFPSQEADVVPPSGLRDSALLSQQDVTGRQKEQSGNAKTALFHPPAPSPQDARSLILSSF